MLSPLFSLTFVSHSLCLFVLAAASVPFVPNDQRYRSGLAEHLVWPHTRSVGPQRRWYSSSLSLSLPLLSLSFSLSLPLRAPFRHVRGCDPDTFLILRSSVQHASQQQCGDWFGLAIELWCMCCCRTRCCLHSSGCFERAVDWSVDLLVCFPFTSLTLFLLFLREISAAILILENVVYRSIVT